MGEGNARIFNIVSLVFLVLTVLFLVFVVVRLMGPPVQTQEVAIALPTERGFPTLPPSNTPTSTQPPTFTPTASNTPTPTMTLSATATISPSPTITETPQDTPTPSNTPTPLNTDTPTPTATPTGPTPTLEPTQSPFLFQLRELTITLTQNYTNTLGCAWQGIGGQVLDQNGQAVNGIQVFVFGNGFDFPPTNSGDNSLYGPGGWEVAVDNKINTLGYFVELRSSLGTVVSERIPVQFPGDCTKNLALVNFTRTR